SGEHYLVLGVLPENYEPDPPTDLYLPEQFDPNSTNQGHIYSVAGRLRPGATIASAAAEMSVIADQFRAAHPDVMDKTESIRVTPLRDAIVGGDIRLQLLIMAGAVGFVLLIACANVASLLLALSPGNLPRINDPDHAFGTLALLDWRMLVFLIGISLFTGLLFGLLPAIRVSHFDVNASLKESSSRSGTGFKHSRIGGLLVMGEIGLAVLLLAGATLMIRTFASLRAMDSG